MAQAPAVRIIFYFTLVAIWLMAGVDGVKESGQGQVSSKFAQFVSYGFQAGGKFDFWMQYTPADSVLEILLCTEDEILKYHHVPRVCDDPEAISCEIHERTFNGSIIIDNYIVQQTALYYVLMGNCVSDDPVTINFNYELTNPGGEQLDTGHEAMPGMYKGLLIFWIIMMGVWLGNWVRHRTQSIPLHRLLSTVPITNVTRLAFAQMYWSSWAQTGRTPATSVLIFAFFSMLIHQAAVITSLALIAKGWCITRRDLTLSDNVAVIALVGGLWVGLLLNQLFGGFSIVVLGIVYLVVLWYITRSVWNLKVTLAALDARMDNSIDVVVNKYNLSKHFLYIVFLYIIGTMIVDTAAMFSPQKVSLVTLFNELVEGLMLLSLGTLFRLRPLPTHAPVSSTDADVPVREEPLPWRPGMPVTILGPGEEDLAENGAARDDDEEALIGRRSGLVLGTPVVGNAPLGSFDPATPSIRKSHVQDL